MNKRGDQHIFQIIIIIDDFADDPSFTQQYELLHALYARGRHNVISTITAKPKVL